MRPEPASQNQPKSTLTRVLTWAAAIMALLSLPLMINFVGRVQDEQRMADAARRSTEAVLKSEVRNSQLHSALEFAKSDAFTERYAREQAHYTKAGEVLVLPAVGEDLTADRRPWWQDFVTVDVTPAAPVTTTVADNSR